MPTYQYACTNPECGERFERVQAFTDPAVSQCPVCGQAVRKVYGSVGVVFKGSGFYRTDSREGSKSSDSLSAASSKESSSKESSSSSKGSSSSGLLVVGLLVVGLLVVGLLERGLGLTA